jgi:hypothetical protein
LTQEIAAQQRRWRYRVHRGHLRFDDEVRKAHRRLRQGILSFLRHASVSRSLTAPVIYSMLLPFLLLDFWVTLYQWVCFPVYGIAPVPRRAYFVLDRHKLGYLNGIEKANCVYCSYATGLIAYVREIAARTELYWCPIKHARPVPLPHSRYHLFFDYGDARSYRRHLPTVRAALPPRKANGRRTRLRRHGH